MTLIIHGSDRTVDHLIIQSLLLCSKCIYAENCTIKSSNVRQIPLGFCDVNTRALPYHNKRPFNSDIFKSKPKTKLCYMNINIYNTDEPKFSIVKQNRLNCVEKFKDCTWVDKETEKLSFESFIDTLSIYKFAICPVGFGIDTHRFYECVAVGTRPIVISSPLDEMYSVFNPLIVNDWSEVTESLLHRQPEYIPNYEALQLEYWLKV